MASVFFAEMTAELAEKKTPCDLLEEIYQKYGYWKDKKDYALEGIEGQKKISAFVSAKKATVLFFSSPKYHEY